MKITTVEYRRLVTGPGYNNTTVGATATVDANETPEDALNHLMAWVYRQYEQGRADETARAAVTRFDEAIADRKAELARLDNELKETRKYWRETVVPFLQSLNLDPDHVPF